MYKYKVAPHEDIKHAVSNKVFLHPEDFNSMLSSLGHKNKKKVYVQISQLVYLADVASYVAQGSVCLSKMQRENLMLSTTMDSTKVLPFRIPRIDFQLAVLKVELKPFRLEYPREIEEKDLAKFLRGLYQEHFFSKSQSLYFDYKGIQMIGRILGADMKQTGISKEKRVRGLFTEETDLEFTCTDIKMLKIKSDSKKVGVV